MSDYRDNFSLKQILTLSAVPFFLLCLSMALKYRYGPYFLGFNSDPEYAYLLNSLNIIHFTIPGHTDHPGTTLQLLGGVVLLFKWLVYLAGGGALSLDEFVLRNPEKCLYAINLALNVLVFFAFLFASFSLRRCTHGALPVLVFQLSLLVPVQVKRALVRVSPEPLLVFSLLMVTALLVRYCHCEAEQRRGTKLPLLVGIGMGFGMATKVTFLPVLLLLLLFSSRKEHLTALGACVVSFLLFTLPITTKFMQMLAWFASIATHTGRYGSGDVGLQSPGVLLNNLISLMEQEPSFFVLLGLYLAYLMLRRFFGETTAGDGKKLLMIGSLTMALQIMLTVKHPGVHYLLPAITLTAFLNAELCTLVKRDAGAVSYSFVLGICVIAFMATWHTARSTKSWAAAKEDYFRNQEVFTARVNAIKDATVIEYYKASSVEYALAFGDSFAGRKYGAELAKIYPGKIFYDMWTPQFHTYESTMNTVDIVELLSKKETVLLVGEPLGVEDKARKNLRLTTLIETPHTAAYRLEGLR